VTICEHQIEHRGVSLSDTSTAPSALLPVTVTAFMISILIASPVGHDRGCTTSRCHLRYHSIMLTAGSHAPRHA
jgi:hypothetical protein